MSKKLEASIKKIEKVFYKCYEKNITLKTKKGDKEKIGAWSENTKKTYTDMVTSFVREYHREFGTADVTKMTDETKIMELIQRRMDRYHAGATGEAFNLKTLTAALAAFNHGVANTNVFNKPFTVGNTDTIRAEMKKQHVIRKSGTSTVLRATPEDCRLVLDKIRTSGYKTSTREAAYHIGKISMMTGGRISSIIKLKAGDVAIDAKNQEITFQKDKGGLTRTVKVDKETADYLASLAESKPENHPLFSRLRNKHDPGTFKSVKEFRKEVEKIITKAGKTLEKTAIVKIKDSSGAVKNVQVTQRFTPHSFRKSFALERASYYLSKFDTRTHLNKYVALRIADEPKLKKKLDTLRSRINEDRLTNRELKPEEYAIFFASVDMGHFRNDIITSFYTTYKEVESYTLEQKERGKREVKNGL